ncbi:MAG: thioredoxin family protein, partial [Candidatus Rifleibacteriota bacterium]
SDWCGWCKKFRAEVLNQKAFQDYAKSNMETFIADFPRTTEQPAEISEQNERLASEYNVSGFPTVVIITPEGEVIEKTGYKEGGAENYVNHLKDILE